jgi:predicted nucleic acid-binding protein
MGDCYLLALSQATGSTLVTFDAGLAALARKAHLDVVLLD